MNDITNYNLEINEEYKKQMKEISDIVAQTGQLLPAFLKAYKDGNIDLFKNFIHENKLQEAFVQNSFHDYIDIHNKQVEECFSKIAEEEGLSYLKKVYGSKFGKKLKDMYKNEKIDIYDICEISNINQKGDIQKQGNIMTQLLELCDDDNLEIGIHRTGGYFGHCINEEGLNLTRNLSCGVINSTYLLDNIKESLEDNISFDYNPGLLLSQIAVGGNYKNYLNANLVDISIIAIPKSEMESNGQELIIKGEPTDKLNPKFIKGYVKVDSKNNTMESFCENPKYMSIENKETSMTVYKKQNRFINWIKEKFYNIKEKFSKDDKTNNSDYINNQEQNNKKSDFFNGLTQNGKLKSKEQQRKQFEIVKKWEEKNKQEIEQENSDKQL